MASWSNVGCEHCGARRVEDDFAAGRWLPCPYCQAPSKWRVVVVGGRRCGKTALLRRWLEQAPACAWTFPC